jgi:hypothetical protein
VFFFSAIAILTEGGVVFLRDGLGERQMPLLVVRAVLTIVAESSTPAGHFSLRCRPAAEVVLSSCRSFVAHAVAFSDRNALVDELLLGAHLHLGNVAVRDCTVLQERVARPCAERAVIDLLFLWRRRLETLYCR